MPAPELVALLERVGLRPLVPWVKLATGDDPALQLRALARTIGLGLLLASRPGRGA